MRLLSALVAGSLIVALASPTVAEEKRPRKRNGEPQYKRSSTVDHRGLCQRDNGRPLDSLNLNHHCDREEFWARIRERPRGR